MDERLPNRRAFLTSASILAIGGLTGCASGGPESPGQRGSPQSTPSGTNQTTQSGQNQTQNQTQGGNVPKSAIATSNHRVITVDEEVVGEVAITNEADRTTEDFRVGMDWLDQQGNYLGTSDIVGSLMDPGETWVARRWAWLELENPEQVASTRRSSRWTRGRR